MRMELQVSAGNLKYALLIWRIFKSRSLWRSFTSSIHEIIPWGPGVTGCSSPTGCFLGLLGKMFFLQMHPWLCRATRVVLVAQLVSRHSCVADRLPVGLSQCLRLSCYCCSKRQSSFLWLTNLEDANPLGMPVMTKAIFQRAVQCGAQRLC